MPRAARFGLEAIGAGVVVSGIAGAYKFAEFLHKAKKLHEVGYENEVFARLIMRVRLDLNETERLLALKDVKEALKSTPQKAAWINNTIYSTKYALNEIGRLTAGVTEDLQDGDHVGIRNRLRWVLDTHDKVLHVRMELASCHQSLLNVLGFLALLEPLVCECGDNGVLDGPRLMPDETTGYNDRGAPRRVEGRIEAKGGRREVDASFMASRRGPGGREREIDAEFVETRRGRGGEEVYKTEVIRETRDVRGGPPGPPRPMPAPRPQPRYRGPRDQVYESKVREEFPQSMYIYKGPGIEKETQVVREEVDTYNVSSQRQGPPGPPGPPQYQQMPPPPPGQRWRESRL